MALRQWCMDDVYYLGQTMNDLFGNTPNEKLLNDKAKFAAKTHDMDLLYRNVNTIAPRCVEKFNEYIGAYKKYQFVESTHTKHILQTQAMIPVMEAEKKLFDTLVQWHLGGRKMDDNIVTGLKEADRLYQEAYKPYIKWVDNMYPVVPGEMANPDRADSEKYPNALLIRSKGIEAWLSLPPDQKPDMTFLQEEVVEK
jgi:hypothetical protein